MRIPDMGVDNHAFPGLCWRCTGSFTPKEGIFATLKGVYRGG